ncbi:MAG: endonuclease III [Alloprevotella sp.]|jgi:endonuclease III|uniref:endonuclease III n=1 Tax=Alloprevotella sp. Lung230 TaxID=2766595 RepID=UPI000F2B82A9|nr:endonuclease III [Alloprevotella sp. Lung230]MBC8625736.1 endonuclease III [Alloprevotella sp. Lung230]RKV73460.1 MAG: endonuclease III [Alloprevotella sp.]
MRKKELYAHVLDFFERTMDATETELDFQDNFQLIVAVVLSAQCTDKRINQVTPRLFADYPTPEAMAEATPEVIYDYIRSVSYPNNKAKHLVGLAQKLVKDFHGEVPSTLEELTSLPGVGRKTANVVQAVAFHKAALAVDTHVFRVSHRLGLVPKSATTPYAVEMALMKHIPTEKVAAGHYWILLHGRYTCLARKPKCSSCGLSDVCPSRKLFPDC